MEGGDSCIVACVTAGIKYAKIIFFCAQFNWEPAANKPPHVFPADFKPLCVNVILMCPQAHIGLHLLDWFKIKLENPHSPLLGTGSVPENREPLLQNKRGA